MVNSKQIIINTIAKFGDLVSNPEVRKQVAEEIIADLKHNKVDLPVVKETEKPKSTTTTTKKVEKTVEDSKPAKKESEKKQRMRQASAFAELGKTPSTGTDDDKS
tara:strand:+ start:292 stop:606 length:315 start_codon:yes stop_codon:yes gene_type:complete